jgi:MFS family permease
MSILLYLSIRLQHQQQSHCSNSELPGLFWFASAAILYGIGQGFNAPSLFAWASDTADNHHRGRALAMLFMFLELGIIVGGLSANYFIQGTSWNYFGIFGFSGAAFIIALLFSLYCLRYKQSQQITAI